MVHPVFCLCKFILPNARLGFGIRQLQVDPAFTLKHGANYWRNYYASNGAVRHQSTLMNKHVPGARAKHRTKKKALVDIIRVKDESVSEGKAKVTRLNQHSIDQTLGIRPAVSSSVSGSVQSDKKIGSSSHLPYVAKSPQSQDSQVLSHDSVYLGEEVSFEMFSNLLKEHKEKDLLSIRDISEVVRWNKGLTHTYDANFIMNDSLRSDGRNVADNDWDIVKDICRGDLSTLSSALSGFAQVNEIDSVVPQKSQPMERKTATHKPKKKVTSSKKKKDTKKKDAKDTAESGEEKKKSAFKQKSRKKMHTEITNELLERENISFGIGSSRVDDCLMEALNEAVVVEEPIKSAKGKSKKASASAKVFNKRLQQEQQFKEIISIKKQCREIVFNQTIEAYLSVCVNVGLLNRALHTLLYYRHLGTLGSGKKITSVQPYNIILHALAEKGNFEKMEELLSLLEQDMIAMNENSFASFLSCLGRQPESFINTQNIQNILDVMEKGGIDIHDVFNKVEYVHDGYESALEAVCRVVKDFMPKKIEINATYNCNLVNSLNDTLYSSKVRSPVSGLATEQELERWAEEQFSCESTGEITVASIEKKEELPEVQYFREKLARWEGRWRESLYSNFVKKVDAMKRAFSNCRRNKEMNLYPYLVCLPPEDYVNIMMQEINRFASGSEGYSLSRYSLYRGIGEHVYQRYLIYYKRETGILEKLRSVYKKYGTWMLQKSHEDGISYIPRVHWKQLESCENQGPSLEHRPTEWPNNVQLAVGQFLYSILMNNVMVWKPLHSEKHVYPALYEVDRSYDYRVIEEIKPAPVLMEVYRRAARPTLTFPSYVAPMVTPPVPWNSPKCGGYLINNSHIVRLPYNAQKQKQRMDECGRQQLYPVMDSLNQLGSVPWRVNKPMLDLIVEVFNNKGWDEMDIPPPVTECPVPPKIKSSMTSLEKKQILRQRLDYNKKKSEMYSLWCDALYKLSFANHFRDRVFWFPHNMDFRGRVYPLPPHINHMSSDVFRSLLFFARGEKLGPNGLQWLKLHLINLTGFVKREAVEDRLKYCEAALDDILDSADNPLTGRQWWTKSDEPWQTLAACKELAAAIRSNDPEEYISHLPIHQDGSCNGLQHYAALGRDLAGAVSVNLAPSRVPQDVYSAVAELVEKERLQDCAEGKEIALLLDGYVQRKVIKQTVMTTVYGVTRFGARLQIERQLKDLNFPPTKTWAASQYLVQKTFLSLEQMFTSAKEIQDWFTDCARMVSKTCRQNMEWVTPLGLPVVQHYTIPLSERCPTVKMGMTVNIDSVMQPNTMKQKNAFPPNFIHSLDSSHMMLTSIYSQKEDITFVSVHDCFWTHAASVDIMNKICREQFVALHEEPILENLSEYLQKQFSFEYKDFTHDGSALDNSKMKVNTLLCSVPHKGAFDIKKILESVYFFS